MPPPTNKARNQLVRSIAQWLARAAGVTKKDVKTWQVQALATILQQGATWVADELPNIVSYLDKPKNLNDLQDAATKPFEEGYQDHHIVEEQADSKNELSNSRIFSRDQLQGRENIVRTPYWKHWEISRWYSRPNEDFGGQTPRDYMRSRSWDEQYNLGLKKLREYGVLK